MHRVRFRVILPTVLGFLAILLFAWDYENDRVVASMGMGWDTGPPMWPYRTVPLVSYAINAPAYIVSWPVLKLLDLRTTWLQYAVWFPFIVVLWWWVGTCIDFGLPIGQSGSHPRLIASLLLVATVGLLLVAARVCVDEYHWFRNYWPGHPPVYVVLALRAIGPTLWCLSFSQAFVRVAIPMFRREPLSRAPYPLAYGVPVLWVSLLCLDVVAIARLDRILSPPPDLKVCEIDRFHRRGCVHGTVRDESGRPISHIEVNLIPTFKMGTAGWHGTKSEWTDDEGRYNFNSVDVGAYILAVNSYEASAGPDEERPFATLYYRNADDASRADAVSVKDTSATNLSPLLLRRLAFSTIPVRVVWENGAPTERSSIVIHNARYYGLLTSKQVDNGTGAMTLVSGFEYEANASVECDGGKVIEQHESKPYREFTVAGGLTPDHLTFVLQGAPCVLWEPR